MSTPDESYWLATTTVKDPSNPQLFEQVALVVAPVLNQVPDNITIQLVSRIASVIEIVVANPEGEEALIKIMPFENPEGR